MSEETKEKLNEERKNKFSSNSGFWICFSGTILLLFESVSNLILYDFYTGFVMLGQSNWMIKLVISFLLTVFAGILISLMHNEGDDIGYYVAFVVIGGIGIFASTAIYSAIILIIGGIVGIINFSD